MTKACTTIRLALSERRYSTARPTRATAGDGSKSVELESRISRLEALVNELREQLALLQRASVSRQAELDHLSAILKER